MRELSLFSGAGGGLLATKYLLGWECKGYVEYDNYCQKVIEQRIKDGLLDAAPIFGDINSFIAEGYAESYSGMVDVITSGFPCQEFSVAGKRAGEKGSRNKWPETRDTIGIVRPRFVLLENVPGLLSFPYVWTILSEITEMGYDCRWGIVGADDAGAPHRRKRWWCYGELADS
jgi:DNA (cytosine-5)-methyltransferase 1